MKRLFLFAGEQSGDLLGGALMEELTAQSPSTHFIGVGGPAMRAQGLTTIMKMEEFRVMGIVDVLKALPKLWRQLNLVRDAILETEPEAVVLIDYPGFNLRLAKALRKRGYNGKIIQYVVPTVWAHGKGRVRTLVENFDLLLAIYPFEPEIFANTTLNTRFVGDPLTEKVRDSEERPLEGGPYLALFPGSRPSEIKLNLPLQLAAAEESDSDLPIAISVAHNGLRPLISEILGERKALLVPPEEAYRLMRNCRAALATSGTVTREIALHEIPTVVVYKISLVTLLFAKLILRLNLPHYCIVNIILGREAFPEFCHFQISSTDVAAKLKPLLIEGEARNKAIDDCREYASRFKTESVSRKAADAILETLCEPTSASTK